MSSFSRADVDGFYALVCLRVPRAVVWVGTGQKMDSMRGATVTLLTVHTVSAIRQIVYLHGVRHHPPG